MYNTAFIAHKMVTRQTSAATSAHVLYSAATLAQCQLVNAELILSKDVLY